MIPSTSFIAEAGNCHRDSKCNFVKCTATTSMEPVWSLLKSTDKRDDPWSKLLAVLIFYSQTFRFRLLEGNNEPIAENEYREIINEWSSLEKPLDQNSYCICGHEVCKSLLLKNSINSNVVRVGYSCAEKFLSGIIVEAVKIIKLNDEYRGTFKICGNCYLHKIPATEEWRQVCPDCYRDGYRQVKSAFTVAFYYKPCKKCSSLTIPGYYPDYKDMCYDCFMIHKPIYPTCASTINVESVVPTQQKKIKCEKCGLPRIPADKSQFKICYTCKFGNK